MKSLVPVLCVWLLSGYAALPESEYDSEAEKELSPDIEFRNHSYFVTLDVRKNQNTIRYCGGAQIGPEWVITAAECLHETGGDEIVMTHSSTSFNYRRKYYRIEQAEFKIHPEFNPNTKNNNLALVRCTSGVQNPHEFPKIPSPSKEKTSLSNKQAVVTVGLDIKNATRYDFYVYEIKTKILSPFWCKLAYIFSVGKEHVCASRRVVKHEQKANVGAPLVTERYTNGTIELVGIGASIDPWTTWIPLPTVFTKVEPHYEWIYNVTKLSSVTKPTTSTT